LFIVLKLKRDLLLKTIITFHVFTKIYNTIIYLHKKFKICLISACPSNKKNIDVSLKKEKLKMLKDKIVITLNVCSNVYKNNYPFGFQWYSNYFNKTVLIHCNFKPSKYNNSDTLNTVTVVLCNLLPLNLIKKYINFNYKLLFNYVLLLNI